MHIYASRSFFSPLKILLFVFCCLSITIFFGLLYFSSAGINLTDEGFALLAIKYPGAFEALFTKFGHIVNPIYTLLGGNFVFLRALTILIIYVLSFSFIYITSPSLTISCLQNTWRKSHQLTSRLLRICLALSLAPLGFLGLWPFLTPSYGSLAFIGLIIFSLPIALHSFDIQNKNYILPAIFSISVAFYIILMSKVTTGLLLSILFLTYCLARPKSRLSYGLASLGIGAILYLLSGVLIHGSFAELLIYFDDTRYVMSGFGSNYYTFNGLLNSISPSLFVILIFILTTLSLLSFVHCITHCPQPLQRRNPLRFFVATATVSALAVFAIFKSGVPGSYILNFSRSLEAFITSFFLAIVCTLFCYYIKFVILVAGSRVSATSLKHIFRRLQQVFVDTRTSSALFFCCLPFLLAFGTSNGFYEYASHGALFFLAAIFIMLRALPAPLFHPLFKSPVAVTALIFLGISPLLGVVSVVYLFLWSPYARPSLLSGAYPHRHPSIQLLRLDSPTYELLKPLLSIKRHPSLSSSNGFIDLTTVGPGLLYLADIKPIGWPWILGSTAGSSSVAERIFSLVESDVLECSHVLISDNPGFLNTDQVLESLSFKLSDTSRYKIISTFEGDVPENSIAHSFKIYAPTNPKCSKKMP